MCDDKNDPDINSIAHYEAMQVRNLVDFMTEYLTNIENDQLSNLQMLCSICELGNLEYIKVLAKCLFKTRIMYLLQDRLNKFNANQIHVPSREYDDFSKCVDLFSYITDVYENLCVELFNNKILINLMMDVMLKLDLTNSDKDNIFLALLNILHNISRREPCLGVIKINDVLKQKVIEFYRLTNKNDVKVVTLMLLLETDCLVDISQIVQYREIFETIIKDLDEASKTEDNYHGIFSVNKFVNMLILLWDKSIIREEMKQNRILQTALDTLSRKDYCKEAVSKLRERFKV